LIEEDPPDLERRNVSLIMLCFEHFGEVYSIDLNGSLIISTDNATISLRSRADEESVSPPISREESIKLPKSAPATRTESITLSELLASRPVYSTYHDSLLNSQVLKDLEYIPENNSMCHSIPISNQSQSFLLKPHHEKDLVLVTRAGTKLIATYDSSSAKDKRFLRDGDDNLAAVVLKSKDGDGHYKFKIFGGQALFPGQRSIGGMGLYKWADVKKSTGLGMQFTMRAKSNPDHPYVSEHYGPSLFKRDTTRRRGFDIKLDQETIVEVTNLGDVQGLALGPEVDPCLMVCFIAIIDEMFKKRIR
jgi:hypothetical protein